MMGTARTILRNTMWLTVGDKIGYALQFVFFLFFAKKYGVVPAGEYSFAFFFTYAFACFADLGASLYLLREVGRGQPLNRDLFFDCFFLRVLSLLTVSFVAGVVVFGTQAGSSGEKMRLLACWGAYWLFYSLADLVLAELNGHGKSASVALLGIWLRLLGTVAGIYLIYLGMNYDVVMIVFPMSSFIYLCTCVAVSVHVIGPIIIRFGTVNHYRRLLTTLTPFFVSVLLLELLSCEDVLILGYLRDDRSVGIYSAAAKIVTFVTGISTFIAVTILPLLARMFAESRGRLIEASERILRYLILAGLPMSVGLALTAGKIIRLLYPQSFSEAVTVLSIVSWAIAAGFIQIIFATLLTAVDRQKEKMIATAVNLLVATVLYVVLILGLSSIGAAIAKVLASVTGVACFYHGVSKHLQKIGIMKSLIGPTLSCAGMALFLWCFESWSLVYLIAGAAGIYAAGLLVLREIKQDDISYIRELLPKAVAAGR